MKLKQTLEKEHLEIQTTNEKKNCNKLYCGKKKQGEIAFHNIEFRKCIRLFIRFLGV